MSATAPQAPATPIAAPDPAALRVVLFGMPDAGKSSLLGALVQTTRTQDRELRGRLLDLSHGLGELWRRVYEDRQKETLEEIVPYPVVYDPYPGDPDHTPRLNAVIYDCDGRVANELLSQRKPLDDDTRANGLARAVLGADALILVVDASASNEQVETDFREFMRFLKVLETYRGEDRAVGGLPVYLVLSKCDLLARDHPHRAVWEARVAERARQVQERFARYLDGNIGPAGTHFVFGSLDLDVMTTAVQRPALADAPAEPREPLGVAELFRDCLHSAYEFRRRTEAANRRLRWTVLGAGGFLAVAILAAFYFFTSPATLDSPTALAARVEQFKSREKPLPERLANDQLQHRARELYALRDDPQFEQLPDEPKSYVRGEIDELQAYLRFREQLAQLGGPERVRTLTELDQVRERLEAQAAVPAKYAKKWEKTPTVLERERRLRDVRDIRDTIEALRAFFTELKTKANDLLFGSELSDDWGERAAAVFEKEKTPPLPRTEPTKGVAYEYDEVTLAEKDWLNSRLRLETARDLALASGAITDPSGEVAVLVPAGTPDADPNAAAAARLQRLKKLYPNWKAWSLAPLPDELQGELRKKLRSVNERMVRDGQRMILARLRQLRPTGPDTPDDWKQIASWLTSDALKDWRELFNLVARLADPSAGDPVAATAMFLTQTSFELQPRVLTLTVPNNLPQGMLVPGDTLTLATGPRDPKGERSTLTFTIRKGETIEGLRDRKYRFVADKTEGKLTYAPGNDFGAEMPLTRGEREWQLFWTGGKTFSYAFEALERAPFIRVAGGTERGTMAEGVSLAIEGKFPLVPALLPDVRRGGK
jgi:GTPase SAR1 family protein